MSKKTFRGPSRAERHQRPENPHAEGAGSKFSRPGRGQPPKDRVAGGGVLLFGFHPVREALRSSQRKIVRLWATDVAAERLADEIAAKGLVPTIVSNEELSSRLPADSVHQGLLAEAGPLEPIGLDELPADGIVLVLDQITDPHNVGAIMRTAAAFNVSAIVTTERHSPAMTGVLAKSASGALEHVPIASVVNLARALEELGDMGYQRVGLDSEGGASLEHIELTRPLALVLGAEGKGLRRLSRENCDVLARLDMPGKIKSLNVSNACAVALTIVRLKLN